MFFTLIRWLTMDIDDNLQTYCQIFLFEKQIYLVRVYRMVGIASFAMNNAICLAYTTFLFRLDLRVTLMNLRALQTTGYRSVGLDIHSYHKTFYSSFRTLCSVPIQASNSAFHPDPSRLTHRTYFHPLLVTLKHVEIAADEKLSKGQFIRRVND